MGGLSYNQSLYSSLKFLLYLSICIFVLDRQATAHVWSEDNNVKSKD